MPSGRHDKKVLEHAAAPLEPAAPEEPEVQVQKDMPPADDGGWLSAASGRQ